MTTSPNAPTRSAPAPAPWRRVASTVVRIAVVVAVVSAEVMLISGVGEEFDPANHYSYFTILSNVFGAVVLAVALVRGVPDPVRGAAVTFLALTGIVYNTMLRGVDVQTTEPSNSLLHVVVPILMVADWVLRPPTTRLTLRHVTWWMAAPVAYLVYTLVRGPVVDWYPYPFLDPRPDGYGTVVVGALSVAVAFFAAALAVRWLGNRLSGAPAMRSAAASGAAGG